MVENTRVKGSYHCHYLVYGVELNTLSPALSNQLLTDHHNLYLLLWILFLGTGTIDWPPVPVPCSLVGCDAKVEVTLPFL